jgi:hypothetical protein
MHFVVAIRPEEASSLRVRDEDFVVKPVDPEQFYVRLMTWLAPGRMAHAAHPFAPSVESMRKPQVEP